MFFRCCRLDEVKPTELKLTVEALSEEQNNYISTKPDPKRHQSLVARVLLFKIIEKSFKSYSLGDLSFDENSKPYLHGDKRLYVSFTHSANMAGCAVSENPIGIDIEKIHPISDKTIARICTKDESEHIIKYGADEFFRFWTFKEALYKADNRPFYEITKSSCLSQEFVNITERIDDYFLTVVELIQPK